MVTQFQKLTMAAMLKPVKKVKSHVEKGLEKVRAKPWAEPLGTALLVSSKIVDGLGSFVPGGNVIGGALAFGATLLDPQPTIKDLQKDIKKITDMLNDGVDSPVIERALQKEIKEMEERMRSPLSEIRSDLGAVRLEMKHIFQAVGDSMGEVSSEMSSMQDKINQTFNIVSDQRYKVSKDKLNHALS